MIEDESDNPRKYPEASEEALSQVKGAKSATVCHEIQSENRVREIRMHSSMSEVGKRSLLATASNLDSTGGDKRSLHRRYLKGGEGRERGWEKAERIR